MFMERKFIGKSYSFKPQIDLCNFLNCYFVNLRTSPRSKTKYFQSSFRFIASYLMVHVIQMTSLKMAVKKIEGSSCFNPLLIT